MKIFLTSATIMVLSISQIAAFNMLPARSLSSRFTTTAFISKHNTLTNLKMSDVDEDINIEEMTLEEEVRL